MRYNDTRKLVLKGVDGIVFVADSLEARRHNNVESFSNLDDNLREQGKSTLALPVVLQYNKRDLAGSKVAVIPVEEMEKDLKSQRSVSLVSRQRAQRRRSQRHFQENCMMTVVDVSTRLLKDKGMSLTGT